MSDNAVNKSITLEMDEGKDKEINENSCKLNYHQQIENLKN